MVWQRKKLTLRGKLGLALTLSSLPLVGYGVSSAMEALNPPAAHLSASQREKLRRDPRAPMEALVRESELYARALSVIPSRVLSRVWGEVHRIDLPVAVREPMYKAWAAVFGSNLDEMEDGKALAEYPNLNAFFTRRIKARDLDEGAIMVCPSDSRVVSLDKYAPPQNEPAAGLVRRAEILPISPTGNGPTIIAKRIKYPSIHDFLGIDVTHYI